MNLYRKLQGSSSSVVERANPTVSLEQWAEYFTYQGLDYAVIQAGNGTLRQDAERVDQSFAGYVHGAYKANGVVFACMLVRLLLFSEARFQFRRRRSTGAGELFGTQALLPLEQPGGPSSSLTTRDLLARIIQDVDLAGNWFGVARPDGRIERLRPDWVTVVQGSRSGSPLDLEVAGYVYEPDGPGGNADPISLLPEQVAHFAPIPDPLARWRGMSWLTPILREISGDSAMTVHKNKYLEQGATPNLVVSLDGQMTREAFEKWTAAMEANHAGHTNAYRTLYLGAGAKAEVIGSNFQQLDFRRVQGAAETRVAAAAGVPPIIVGLSEGLEAATYSNYGQARRRFADGTMIPLWGGIAGTLAKLVALPAGAELWYDLRDVAFLREDQRDEADIQSTVAGTISTLIQAGFEPGSVVSAVDNNDLRLLVHSGLYSVQLQPAGAQDNLAEDDQGGNGNGDGNGVVPPALLAGGGE